MGSQLITQAPRIAKSLPLIAGGITATSQTKPEDLEYLKDGFLSLINPSSNSLNPLKEILKSKNEMITVEEPFDIKKEVATKKDFNPEDFEKIKKILKGSGFTESEDMNRLPGFTEVKEEKVNIGDVGFTEAEQMPTILTAGKDEAQIQNKEKETYFGTEEAKESFYDASSNIDIMFDTNELNKPANQKTSFGQNIPAHEFYEEKYHGGVGDLGNADAFKKLKKLSYYPEYKKLIQESAKEHLGERFPAYRLVRGDMEAYRKGMPSLEKDINSYSLDPERALSLHNLIDYSEGLGKNRNSLVLQEVYINAKDLVMRGKEAEEEIVVNTKKLDTDTVRVFDPFTGEMIKDATKGELVDKELFKFSDKTKLGGKKDKLLNEDDFIKF